MAIDLAVSKTNLPKIVIKGILYFINKIIMKKAGFSIKNLDLTDKIKNCNTPIMFATSKDDTLILHWHSEKLYENYGANKNIIYFTGNHSE